MKRCFLLAALALGAMGAACGGPASTAVEVTNTAAATTAASAAASATSTPAATDIPGFEGWSVLNPQAVDIKTDNGKLVMTLTKKALWFMTQRGVLLYKPVTGTSRSRQRCTRRRARIRASRRAGTAAFNWRA